MKRIANIALGGFATLILFALVAATPPPIQRNQFTTNDGTFPVQGLATFLDVSVRGTVNPLQQVNLRQGFEPRTTWLVMLGDSITSDSTRPSYPFLLTNMSHWSSLAFYTNQSVGGDTFAGQTNIFFTSTYQRLPPLATNGTNVIISIFVGANDFIYGTNYDWFVTAHSNFFTFLHTKGYIVVRPTILPRTNFTDVTYSNVFKFNNWVARSSNQVDCAPDFFRTLPDNTDLTFFDSDFIHPNSIGQLELVKTWDTAVRLRSRLNPLSIERTGNGWQFRTSASSLSAKLNDNGTWSQVLGGLVLITPSPNSGGVFASGVDGSAALIAQGVAAQTTPVFAVVPSAGGSGNFQVFDNGHWVANGACDIQGGGTLKIHGGGSGGILKLAHDSAKEYYVSANSDGSLRLTDNSSSKDRLIINTLGFIGFGTNQVTADVLLVTNNLTIAAGGLITVTSGSNQRAGNLTLVGGTKTVANTTVSANTIVMLTRKTSGGTVGTAITYTLSAGTSFTVASDNVLDTSTFSYILVEVP